MCLKHSCSLLHRLMVGHDTLDVGILVRIQVKQPSQKPRAHSAWGFCDVSSPDENQGSERIVAKRNFKKRAAYDARRTRLREYPIQVKQPSKKAPSVAEGLFLMFFLARKYGGWFIVKVGAKAKYIKNIHQFICFSSS